MDDAILVAELEELLGGMVGYFNDVCWRVLKVSACKSKVLVFEREGLQSNISLDRKVASVPCVFAVC